MSTVGSRVRIFYKYPSVYIRCKGDNAIFEYIDGQLGHDIVVWIIQYDNANGL
ncbi:MAG: hypothetical protein IPM96_18840 [Ignavibacteria bacterium]|nr:hypothetical protein [Ignavibacteria bacterium]